MEKTLIIDNRSVNFKSSGAFLLRYKAQFGRDAIKDLGRLEKAISETATYFEDGSIDPKTLNFEAMDLEVFYNLSWCLAKTADPTIPTVIPWLDTFEEFPLGDILPELTELLEKSIAGSKKK